MSLTQEQINYYSELMAKMDGIENGLDYALNKLKYHTSYDWLHRVWEKFRDLKFEDKIQDNDHTQWLMSIEIKLCYKSITEAFLELGKGLEWYYSLKK